MPYGARAADVRACSVSQACEVGLTARGSIAACRACCLEQRPARGGGACGKGLCCWLAWYPPRCSGGGIETHCENLFLRMAELRPEVEIVIYGRAPYIGAQPYRTASGLQVVPAYAARNKYLETISNTFVALLQARFRERPDYVHLHAIGPGGLLAPPWRGFWGGLGWC